MILRLFDDDSVCETEEDGEREEEKEGLTLLLMEPLGLLEEEREEVGVVVVVGRVL